MKSTVYCLSALKLCNTESCNLPYTVAQHPDLSIELPCLQRCSRVLRRWSALTTSAPDPHIKSGLYVEPLIKASLGTSEA
jgi:hypothetical protein